MRLQVAWNGKLKLCMNNPVILTVDSKPPTSTTSEKLQFAKNCRRDLLEKSPHQLNLWDAGCTCWYQSVSRREIIRSASWGWGYCWSGYDHPPIIPAGWQLCLVADNEDVRPPASAAFPLSLLIRDNITVRSVIAICRVAAEPSLLVPAPLLLHCRELRLYIHSFAMN